MGENGFMSVFRNVPVEGRMRGKLTDEVVTDPQSINVIKSRFTIGWSRSSALHELTACAYGEHVSHRVKWVELCVKVIESGGQERMR